jgi:hypothetical protein
MVSKVAGLHGLLPTSSFTSRFRLPQALDDAAQPSEPRAMRNRNYNIIATAAITVLLAACGENSLTPVETPRATPVSRAPSFDIQVSTGLASGETRQADFVISPSGSSIAVEGFATLSFPANSVCDPAVSTYGAQYWDDACVTITAPLTVHVTYGSVNGTLGFDFSPALRFAPASNQAGWVTISTDVFAQAILANKDYYASHKADLNVLAFYYATSLTATRERDWDQDKSMKTRVDMNTGRVWRRIKHFSGYNIQTGEPCTPSPDDPDCVDMGDGGHG